MKKQIYSGFSGYREFNYISIRDMMKNLTKKYNLEKVIDMPLKIEESAQAYKINGVLLLCTSKFGDYLTDVFLFGDEDKVGEVEKIIVNEYKKRLGK